MKILKPIPSWQWEKLQGFSPSVKATGMKWENGDLSYDFIEGTHPTDGKEMHRFGESALWGGGPLCQQPIDRVGYVKYCANRVTGHYELKPVLDALGFILDDELTPVADCHGDFTNQNVIRRRRDHRLVMIDPGHDRGLPCRELDESKMLQSVEGFCELHRGTPRLCWQMSPSRIQLVLLMTHYIRLLHHITDQRCVEFAVSRIKGISRLFS